MIERKVLVEISDCPKLANAEIVLNGTRRLRLWGKGAEYNLLSVDRERHTNNTVGEIQRRWAESQRKRRSAPKANKANRKLIALDKEIAKLEKRIHQNWYWNDEAPKNPILNMGEPVENMPESKREEEGCLWNWERRAWQEAYAEKPLRRKVGKLALQGWKRWQDLIDALAAIGITFPKKPKLAGKPCTLREIDTASKLVSVCGLTPTRRGDIPDYWESIEAYHERRNAWLERKRERKALESRLADLRELRAMPEKLAASDIGLSEGIEVSE